MVLDTVEKFSVAAKGKIDFLNSSFIKYFILSMMAGAYVGFGIMLIFIIGAPFKEIGSSATKALMGASFGIALTLVIFAGSELFTGNNMVMTIGSLDKKTSWMDAIKIWVVSYVGNLAGSLMLALLISLSGIIVKNPANTFITTSATLKMNAPFSELLFRGILCNMLVCLAVWCSARVKEDTAKLVLIFWCLFGFIGSGLEHSVANMTLLGMSLFIPHDPNVSWMGMVNNLIPVTIGNFIGGAIFIGAAYWFVASASKKQIN
ncbi:MAG: formate/nitrite transporter family protein [Oligoflexia bacterium]|nr:formate/nitrite transporter family protein [Oligoflexia bacterium]